MSPLEPPFARVQYCVCGCHVIADRLVGFYERQGDRVEVINNELEIAMRTFCPSNSCTVPGILQLLNIMVTDAPAIHPGIATQQKIIH